jgi:hypothetical protein
MAEYNSRSLKRRCLTQQTGLIRIGECFRITQKPLKTSVDCTFHKKIIKIVDADIGDVVHVIKCTRCCCKNHEFDNLVMVELLNGTGQCAHIPVNCIDLNAQLMYKCFLCGINGENFGSNFDQGLSHLIKCHMQDDAYQGYTHRCPACNYRNNSAKTIQNHFSDSHDLCDLITFLDQRFKGQLIKYLMINAGEQQKKFQYLEFNQLKTPNQHFKEENQLIKDENKHFKEENKHFKEENKHFKEENKHFKEENQHFKEENQHFKEENQHFKDEIENDSKSKLNYIKEKEVEIEYYKASLRNLQESNEVLFKSNNTLNLDLKNAKDEMAKNETANLKAKLQQIKKQLSKVQETHLKDYRGQRTDLEYQKQLTTTLKTYAKSKEAEIEQLKAKSEILQGVKKQLSEVHVKHVRSHQELEETRTEVETLKSEAKSKEAEIEQ